MYSRGTVLKVADISISQESATEALKACVANDTFIFISCYRCLIKMLVAQSIICHLQLPGGHGAAPHGAMISCYHGGWIRASHWRNYTPNLIRWKLSKKMWNVIDSECWNEIVMEFVISAWMWSDLLVLRQIGLTRMNRIDVIHFIKANFSRHFICEGFFALTRKSARESDEICRICKKNGLYRCSHSSRMQAWQFSY